MMTQVVWLLLSTAWAQQIVPVLDNKGMRTGITIPFHFQSSAGHKLNSVKIESSGTSCKVDRDFYHEKNILLKCAQAENVVLVVEHTSPSGLVRLNYGPLAITDLRPGYKEPTPSPTPPALDPRGFTGRQVLASSCKFCHTAPTTANGVLADLRNEGFAALKSAVSSGVRSMGALPPQNRPSDTELQAIEIYLKNIEGYGGWP